MRFPQVNVLSLFGLELSALAYMVSEPDGTVLTGSMIIIGVHSKYHVGRTTQILSHDFTTQAYDLECIMSGAPDAFIAVSYLPLRA